MMKLELKLKAASEDKSIMRFEFESIKHVRWAATLLYVAVLRLVFTVFRVLCMLFLPGGRTAQAATGRLHCPSHNQQGICWPD